MAEDGTRAGSHWEALDPPRPEAAIAMGGSLCEPTDSLSKCVIFKAHLGISIPCNIDGTDKHNRKVRRLLQDPEAGLGPSSPDSPPRVAIAIMQP